MEWRIRPVQQVGTFFVLFYLPRAPVSPTGDFSFFLEINEFDAKFN